MTPEQVTEAHYLLNRLGKLDGLIASCANPEGWASGALLSLCVDCDDELFHDVKFPLETMALIAPELRGEIVARLTHLGVKMPEDQNG
jgi:hypothetical protein